MSIFLQKALMASAPALPNPNTSLISCCVWPVAPLFNIPKAYVMLSGERIALSSVRASRKRRSAKLLLALTSSRSASVRVMVFGLLPSLAGSCPCANERVATAKKYKNKVVFFISQEMEWFSPTKLCKILRNGKLLMKKVQKYDFLLFFLYFFRIFAGKNLQ